MAETKTWVEMNLADIDCTLAWSSDKNILNYDGKHVFFHTVDRTLLFLEEAILSRKKMGVLVYPVNKNEIAIPLCVEALYSLMKTGDAKRKVLLLSQDLSVRELFWNLRANHMRINEVFPLGIVKMDGGVKPQLKTSDVSRISEVKCSFLHSSNPDFLPDKSVSSQIGCLIVDTSGIRPEAIDKLIEWSEHNRVTAVVFLESNPYSENFTVYNKHSLPIWGWDTNSLHEDFKSDLTELEDNPDKYSNPFSFSVFLIKNWLLGIKRTFIEVDAPQFTSTFKESQQLYFDIKKLCSQTKSQPLAKALLTYVSCKYAFERMLAPIVDTEAECKQSFMAKSIEKRIETLEFWQNVLSRHDPYFSSFWGKTYSLAKELYHKFQTFGNPKFEKLKEILKQSLQDKQRVLIYNYNEPYARALATALCRDLSMDEDTLVQKGIFIASIANPQLSGDFDKCIIFGQVPFRAGWLLRVACAREIVFLIYPTEKFLLKHQFDIEAAKFANSFSTESRMKFVKILSTADDIKVPPPIPAAQGYDSFSMQVSESDSQEQEKIKSLMQDIRIDEELALDEEVNIDDDEVEESTVTSDGKIMVKCCKMVLDDGSIMYFKPSRKLPVFKDGRKLEYMDYHKVKQGDLLIVIKNNIRNNLAQEIIRKADNHPSMQRLKFLVNSWVVALRKGMVENEDSISAFLSKLQNAQREENCQEITNWLTIQLWRDGLVIGPQNPKNIMLIGKIYNQQFLVEHYKEIGKAISRLRGIHQRLLRKFNELVMLAGIKNLKEKISDELIDEEFNLHLEDFADVIVFARIVSINPEAVAEKTKLDRRLRESQ